ncbi:MAG: hypothetical protein ACRYFU_17805 [Janthinobacterium lividum]
MKLRFAAHVLCTLLFGSTNLTLATAQYQQQGPPPPQGQGYGQGYGPGQGPGGWDAPPQEYSDFQRQGFHDGMQAAHQDAQNQQRPNPTQHMEFRHPRVPPPARNDYRDAFRKGYFMAMHHMRDGGPGGPPR